MAQLITLQWFPLFVMSMYNILPLQRNRICETIKVICFQVITYCLLLSLQDHDNRQSGGQECPCLAFDERVLLSAWWMRGWLRLHQPHLLLIDRRTVFCCCSMIYEDIAMEQSNSSNNELSGMALPSESKTYAFRGPSCMQYL